MYQEAEINVLFFFPILGGVGVGSGIERGKELLFPHSFHVLMFHSQTSISPGAGSSISVVKPEGTLNSSFFLMTKPIHHQVLSVLPPEYLYNPSIYQNTHSPSHFQTTIVFHLEFYSIKK